MFSRESGEREKVAALKHSVPEVKQNLGEVKTSLVQHRETHGLSKHCHADPLFFFFPAGKMKQTGNSWLPTLQMFGCDGIGALESQE